MEIIIVKDKSEMGKEAACRVAELIRRKPNAVLGLATGSTPETCYAELVRMHKEEGLDFSQVTTFNLDEYYPIDPEHDQSYRYFMNEKLFKHINIKLEPRQGARWGNTYVPYGLAEDPEAQCEEYERWIKEAGGIDLQILGIGSNGHIAFNEPTSSLGSRTRIKALTAQTIKDNSRFFEREEDVPRHAITMGIGTIMDAREILLLANGEGKADAIAAAVEGPVSAMCPASVLQLHHRVRFIIDEGAASKLKLRDYYDHVQQLLVELKRRPTKMTKT